MLLTSKYRLIYTGLVRMVFMVMNGELGPSDGGLTFAGYLHLRSSQHIRKS